MKGTVQRSIDTVLAAFAPDEPKPMPAGGWLAHCPGPTHKRGDKRPGLKIDYNATEGRTLIYCHGGCTTEDVLMARGLELADLYDESVEVVKPRRVVATYSYPDEHGEICFQVRRFSDKSFSQRKPDGKGGWAYELNGVKRVPYRLPDILARPNAVIWLVEGEKDADNLAAIGKVATTNAGGAGKWLPEYNQWFAGRSVVILPDNDEKGIAHAVRVASQLFGVASAVRIVRLPGLPEKGDVSDWLEDGHTAEELAELARSTPELTEIPSIDAPNAQNAEMTEEEELIRFVRFARLIGDFSAIRLFPIERFPDPVGRFVIETAGLMRVPPDYIAIPILAALATAIGRRVKLVMRPGRRGWKVRPILWLAMVGAPGEKKTPAFGEALQFLHVLQDRAQIAYEQAYQQYEQAVEQRNSKPPKERGERPAEPELRHFWTNDATIEKLAVMARHSFGLLLEMDELLGWIRGFDMYRSGKGNDRQRNLSGWSGEAWKVDRKGGGTIYIPEPHIVIAGNIQPGKLSELASEASQADGFVDRIQWCWPEPVENTWDEGEVPDELADDMQELFDTLSAGDFEPSHPHDLLHLSAEARVLWRLWYNRNSQDGKKATDLFRGVWSKMSTHAAQLALILHCIKYPEFHRQGEAATVTFETLVDALHMTEYFRSHAVRVMSYLSNQGARARTMADRICDALWLNSGDPVPMRDIRSALSNNVDAYVVHAVLNQLVEEGRAEQIVTERTGKRGRPAMLWKPLIDARNAQNAQIPACIDIDTLAAEAKTQYEADKGAEW